MKTRRYMAMVWTVAILIFSIHATGAAFAADSMKTDLIKTDLMKMDLLKQVNGLYVHKDTGEPANGAFEGQDPIRHRKEIITLKNGLQDGPFTIFHKDSDTIKEIRHYDMGKITDQGETFREDGSLWQKKWKEKGLHHKEVYDKSGQLMSRLQYDAFSLKGDNYAYYPDGRIKIEIRIGEPGSNAPYLSARFLDHAGNAHDITAPMIDAMMQGDSDKIDPSWILPRTNNDADKQNLYKEAQRYFNTGKNLRAVISLSALVKADPANAEAIYLRGRNYSLLKRYPEAIADYTRVLDITPEFHRAHWYRGRAYFLMKDWKNALTDMEIMAQKAPNDTEPDWVLLAEANYRMNHFQRAIDLSNRLLQETPKYYQARWINGLAHAKNKNEAMALKRYQEMLRYKPKDTNLFNTLVKVFTTDQAYGSLERLYQTRLALQPGTAKAYNGLAWFYATVEDPGYRNSAKAVDAALKALEIKESASYLDTLGAAYVAGGQTDQAVATYEKVLGMSDRLSKKYQDYLQKHGYDAGGPGDLSRMKAAIRACVTDGHYLLEALDDGQSNHGQTGANTTGIQLVE